MNIDVHPENDKKARNDHLIPVKLWRSRSQAFRKEAFGYWQYVLKSSFLGYVFLLLIVGTYYYVRALHELPRDYPYVWIVMLVLVPLLAASPIRTYIVSPDRIFLLSLEGKLDGYFRAAMRRSFLVQAPLTALGVLAVWPLYRICTGPAAQPLWLLLGLLLLAKWAALLSAWQESRLVHGRARAASAVLRWGAAAALVPLAFVQGAVWAALFLLATALVWTAGLRFARRFLVGWETLIRREEASRRRYYRFFAMFLDVTPLPPAVRRRSLAASVTRLYKFERGSAYTYLFTKSMLRTDLFTMLLRTTLVALFVAVVISSDYARTAVLVIAAVISSVQLTALHDAHRYTFWVRMYPLKPEQQISAVHRIMIWTLTVQALLFAVALLLRASSPVYALAPLLCLGLIALYYQGVIRPKWMKAILSSAE